MERGKWNNSKQYLDYDGNAERGVFFKFIKFGRIWESSVSETDTEYAHTIIRTATRWFYFVVTVVSDKMLYRAEGAVNRGCF